MLTCRSQPSLGGGRRPCHHRRRRLSDRQPAAARGAHRRRRRRASCYASSTDDGRRRAAGLDGGRDAGPHRRTCRARRRSLEVGAPLATGLHQVDNPVFDRDGNLYVTYSGTRGQQVPVSIFRVSPHGPRASRSPRASSIRRRWPSTPAGHLYVSSRFEGTVYRVRPTAPHEPFASRSGRRLRTGLRPRRRAVCRRSLGHDLRASQPDGQARRRDAAAERGRVSSGGRARRLRCM